MMLAVCVPRLASASFALSGLGRRMVKRLEDLPTDPAGLMLRALKILPERLHKHLNRIRAESPKPMRDAKRLLKNYVAQAAKK